MALDWHILLIHSLVFYHLNMVILLVNTGAMLTTYRKTVRESNHTTTDIRYTRQNETIHIWFNTIGLLSWNVITSKMQSIVGVSLRRFLLHAWNNTWVYICYEYIKEKENRPSAPDLNVCRLFPLYLRSIASSYHVVTKKKKDSNQGASALKPIVTKKKKKKP